jgi:CubicO group peptidase (beta-lactamase class C family)
MLSPTRFAVITLVGAALVASSSMAAQATVDQQIRRVEGDLLPTVALKENLGRPQSIAQRMQDLGIPGISIAVIDGGKVAWTRAYGLSDTVEKTVVTPQTLFQAGSISKPIAALGALRLVKEGKLSLDEDVNAKLRTWHVPENEFTKDEKVTLRRLVSHTAGLTVHGFPGYAVAAPIPTVVQVLDGTPPANTAPIRVDVQPGSKYRYSGGGYTVMQLMIADVTGQPFASYMQSQVLDVLGMKSSTYMQDLPAALAPRMASAHRSDGTRIPGKRHIYPEMAAAGLWTTPTDLAQYLLYVQAAVRGTTGPLLNAALTKELVKRQNGGEHGLGPTVTGDGESARFGHGGVDEGFDAHMLGYVSQGKGVVIMANANFAQSLFGEITASVARAYEWPGFPQKEQLAAERISKSLLERAPGKYQLTPEVAAELRPREGRLFLSLSDGGGFEVFAKSATELFTPLMGPSTFSVVESNGKVTALRASDGREFKRMD